MMKDIARTKPKADATAPADTDTAASEFRLLDVLDQRLRWLSAWLIHNANHVRPSRDDLKVGGHQASCASISTIMTALYFRALGPNDKVAVKPHAGPVLHAIHYLAGSQSRDQLEAFRGFGGAQSYPSRTKDRIPVDFSTGSVGLGVAVTAFASLAQDYLLAHGLLRPEDTGRMVALMGDAELDEGNIYECLIEAYKHDVRNCWWIVDYNRQSLDHTTADRMFRRFDDIFRTCGWRVVTLKNGILQRAAFGEPGGPALRSWIDTASNVDYAALTYQGGGAWRERLVADIGEEPGVAALLAARTDDELAWLMTNLGGHCIQSIVEAFEEADDDLPTLFIAYTIKGNGLPFAGHKDNHSGLMTPTQIDELRQSLDIPDGKEWDPWAGIDSNTRVAVESVVRNARFVRDRSVAAQEMLDVPAMQVPTGLEQSTQAGFGKLLLELAKGKSALATRIVTTSPDVTVSTNLGGWVNQRGLFRRQQLADVFRAARIPSAQKWEAGAAGQHVELGIAENNLFLVLAAFGLTASVFGPRLLPIGTVYDPFIARGLDALNYACYQDARFILVATPSGISLGPEGGAHQSINPPLIAMGQPGLRHYEPAFVDELTLLLGEALRLVQTPKGESVYFRLSTRSVRQIERSGTDWQAGAVKGGYWLKPPGEGAEAAIVAMGALVTEALDAWDAMIDDLPGLGLLVVTSPDLLHREWSARTVRSRKLRDVAPSHIETLLSALPAHAGLATMLDGAPGALSWLGGVDGRRVVPLGVDRFGQTGDLPDLYREYRLDRDAVIDAMVELMTGR